MRKTVGRSVAVATLALACVLVDGPAWAASGRVRGHVTAPDGRPVAGVAVSAGAAAAVTGPGGLYELEGVEAGGRVVVTFAKEGYATTYGAVELPASDDSDGDGVPDAEDRCPTSDLRPRVSVDGCDTGLGNGIRRGCTAMDVFLDCAEEVSGHAGGKRGHGRMGKSWHLLACLAQPRFLRRVDDLTCRTLRQAMTCVRRARFPLEELEHREALPQPEATLHRTLVPLGVTKTLSGDSGGTVELSGFKITFAPGSIDASGSVEVALTPVDVTGPGLGAFPGDFRAVDRSRGDALLESWGLVGLTITQGGRPVSLRAAASLELPLPEDAPYPAGTPVAPWSFDPSRGLWSERPTLAGTVTQPSPGHRVLVGSVDGPGWWSVDRAVEVACLCGQVTDARGLAVEGALLTATDLDRFAVSSARSAADGSYCVETRAGADVALRASAVVEGLRLDSGPAQAVAPGSPARCAEGGCGNGPTLELPAVSCVCGRTLDALGQPRPGVAIATSAGSAAASDVDGRFCLGGPAEQAVAVFGEGYPKATVTTLGPASCPYGCAVVDLLPAAPAEACLSGIVVDAVGGGVTTGFTAEALEPGTGVPLGPPVGPDPAGVYTLGGLPVGVLVDVRVLGPGCTGALPGVLTEESQGSCQALPPVVCQGPS